MGKAPITKYALFERIKARNTYLYKLGILATPCYTDDAIDYILENEIECIDGEYLIKDAKKISRKKSYNLVHNPESVNQDEGALMSSEKLLVKNMFSGKIEHNEVFGELIEYEVPLNDKQKDGTGDIDFISKYGDKLWMVEIKRPKNDKSLLRAVLEIQSYYQIVDREKLINSFREHFSRDTKIEKIVAIFNDSEEARQYRESKKIKRLIEMFNIKIIRLIKYSDSEIYVEEF